MQHDDALPLPPHCIKPIGFDQDGDGSADAKGRVPEIKPIGFDQDGDGSTDAKGRVPEIKPIGFDEDGDGDGAKSTEASTDTATQMFQEGVLPIGF